MVEGLSAVFDSGFFPADLKNLVTRFWTPPPPATGEMRITPEVAAYMTVERPHPNCDMRAATYVLNLDLPLLLRKAFLPELRHKDAGRVGGKTAEMVARRVAWLAWQRATNSGATEPQALLEAQRAFLRTVVTHEFFHALDVYLRHDNSPTLQKVQRELEKIRGELGKWPQQGAVEENGDAGGGRNASLSKNLAIQQPNLYEAHASETKPDGDDRKNFPFTVGDKTGTRATLGNYSTENWNELIAEFGAYIVAAHEFPELKEPLCGEKNDTREETGRLFSQLLMRLAHEAGLEGPENAAKRGILKEEDFRHWRARAKEQLSSEQRGPRGMEDATATNQSAVLVKDSVGES